MNRIFFIICFICTNVYIVFSQPGDSLTAGILTKIYVSLPKERNYPKYTLKPGGNNVKLTNIIEVYDSVRAEKVLSASATPNCNCTFFTVDIIGINKNGSQEKIGSIEYPVKNQKIYYPEWLVTYTPHNETVEKNDTLPIQKNIISAALGTKHNVNLVLPVYGNFDPNSSMLRYTVKMYQKVGMGDYRYMGGFSETNTFPMVLLRNNSIGFCHIISISPNSILYYEKNAMNYMLYEIEVPKEAAFIPCDPEKDPKKRAAYNSGRYKFAIGFFPNSKPSKMPPQKTPAK